LPHPEEKKRMFNHYDTLDRLGSRLSELRDQFGPQPWLTIVSGVTAEAYRLAGMTAEEFAELLGAQMTERDRLLIHLRRKPIMRLRKGFDDQSGGITDKDGIAYLNLHFQGGSYMERSAFDDRGPTLHIPNPRTSLFVAGGCYAPVAEIAYNLPRCLRPGSVRGGKIWKSRWGNGADMLVHPHWETLALMPADVARSLGVAPQETLDQMPWLGMPTPRRQSPRCAQLNPQRQAAEPRPRPKLTLISSS
jgi:hypothetical protein